MALILEPILSPELIITYNWALEPYLQLGASYIRPAKETSSWVVVSVVLPNGRFLHAAENVAPQSN